MQESFRSTDVDDVDDVRVEVTASGATGSVVVAPGENPDPVVLRKGRMVWMPLLDRLVPASRLQLGMFLIVLNLTDVMVTKVILASGGAEGNPLMKDLMQGFAAPLGVKLAAACTAAVLLVLCPATSRLADRAATTVVGLYLAIIAWNCALLAYLTFG